MGALKKHKLEGGHGRKLGHSNMDHWVTTSEIKNATRRARRRSDKKIIRDNLKEKNDGENR
jgi:hypothetical protein